MILVILTDVVCIYMCVHFCLMGIKFAKIVSQHDRKVVQKAKIIFGLMTLWLSIYFICQSLSYIVPLAECELKDYCEVDLGFLFYHRFQTFTNGIVQGLIMMFALMMIAKDWRSQEEIDGEIFTVSYLDQSESDSIRS